MSSHLLAEVEATCTHVAVLQSGSLIAEGELRGLLDADATGLVVTTPDADLAVATLRAADIGAYREDADEPAVVVPAGDAPEVIALLVRAGVAVQEARRRRPRLEELFARLTRGHRERRARPTTRTLAPTAAPLGRLLGAEVRWVLRRPRTLVMLGLFALIPVLIAIGVAVTDRRAGPAAGSSVRSPATGSSCPSSP